MNVQWDVMACSYNITNLGSYRNDPVTHMQANPKSYRVGHLDD
jgi:hypothetical protein